MLIRHIVFCFLYFTVAAFYPYSSVEITNLTFCENFFTKGELFYRINGSNFILILCNFLPISQKNTQFKLFTLRL